MHAGDEPPPATSARHSVAKSALHLLAPSFCAAMEEPLINSLPNELLTWIFEITPSDDDRNRPGYTAWHRRLEYYPWLRFMLVCRRWRSVGERLLYRKMSLKLLDEPMDLTAFLSKTTHVCPFVRDLHLTVSLSQPADKPTLGLLRKFNSVRKLTLTGRPYKIGRSVLEIIRTMPLIEVSLNSLPSMGMMFEFFGHPTLTHLSVFTLSWSKTFNPPVSKEEHRSGLDDDNASDTSPSLNPSTAIEQPSIADDTELTRQELDKILPSSRHKTSKITSIHFARPFVGVDVARYLFLWPARLEEVKIRLLTAASVYEEYTAQGIQRLLSPQADSIRNVDIGVMTQGSDGIPDFSNFSSLEDLTISAYNLFHDSPERAHEKLSTATLKRLEISFSTEEMWTESLNDFGENELLWMEEFIELISVEPITAKLKSIYIRFRPQPTHPPRDDVEEWPWDMFEELAEISEERGITLQYDPAEYTKRQFSERYESPSESSSD